MIQKEIEEFESKKKSYSKQNTAKRQKTSTTPTTYAGDFNREKKTARNEDAVARLNRINAKLASQSFPRNEAVENNERTIIDEEDDKMTDADEKSGGKASDQSSSSAKVVDSNGNGNSDDDSGSDSENSSSDDDSDNDSDDDEPMQKRQRGRRRRGRQDTAKKIEEINAEEEKSKAAAAAAAAAAASTDPKSEGANDGGGSSAADDDNNNNNKGKKQKRYCLGRKPVTDFVIGQSHPAKVVYVKPFGVFFDIGCHSDAFCHVSRLSDDFIEKPESRFKEGDDVPKVRIVEIDRKQKRITVSLQSEARIEDERKSIEDRKSRKEKMKQKANKKAMMMGSSGQSVPTPSSKSSSNSFGSRDSFQKHSRSNIETAAPPKKVETVFKKAAPPPPSKSSASASASTDPSKMTPAELKRARKLARRAERRAQADNEGPASQ
eukprot:jgi/Psemu1/323245/estExt_fgenesh1_pg.C_630039